MRKAQPHDASCEAGDELLARCHGIPAPTVARTGIPAGSNPSRQKTLMPK
jgi:hypothetical protein